MGRSDHQNFFDAGIPSVFFTDATSGCYHTAQDDVDIVDFGKLDRQIQNVTALAVDLVATVTPPAIDPTAPLTTFGDAESLLRMVKTLQADFGRLRPSGKTASDQYAVELQAIVDAGPDAFNDATIGTMLGGAGAFVESLANGPCDGYLG